LRRLPPLESRALGRAALNDLAKIGSLLSLQGAGVFEVNHRGGAEWLSAAHAYRLLPQLERLCWEGEPQINAVPLRAKGHYLDRFPSSIIWVRTSTKKAIASLRQFRPAPDVVLREGATVRYTAFWALREPLDLDGLERANKRLAKHFQTGYGSSSQDFTFHLPGTVLRTDRRRPIMVSLAKWEIPDPLHDVRDVVGKLKDPPSDLERREMMIAAKEREAAAAQRAQRELERAAEVGVST
jgi:hypothetical protein